MQVRAVLDAYADAMELEHGFRPSLSRADYNHARQLVVQEGPEGAVEVAEGFPRLDDRWLRQNGYPLRFAADRANAVRMLGRDVPGRCSDNPKDWEVPT